MTIIDNRNHLTTFKQVPNGKVCIYQGQVIMKMLTSDTENTNAVYLESGCAEFIYPDETVENINVKLIIE